MRSKNITTIDTDTAQAFADTFNDGLLMNHVGPRLTCTEVEALAGMLRTIGAGHAADRWVTAHAVGDEEGDVHYEGAAPGYVCKTCGGPSPVGVGYVSNEPGAAEASAGLTQCRCGQGQLATETN